MKLTTLAFAVQVLLVGAPLTAAFSTTFLQRPQTNTPSSRRPFSNAPVIALAQSATSFKTKRKIHVSLHAANDEDEEEEEKVENPYADPNYPDLEFVNYDDPEYAVDQGVTDEFFSSDEEEVEGMREDRRRRNDEFQFETYHEKCLKSGDSYKGEWTVYRTSTFLDGVEESEVPSFKKEKSVRKVVTSGKKVKVEDVPEGGFEFRVDGERIVHEERLAEAKDFEDEEEWEEHNKAKGKGDVDDWVGTKRYWPEELSARDFRGEAGIMCVGNCYTICDSIGLHGDKEEGNFDGPFSELRTEIGIQYKRLRLRVKWDYRVKAQEVTEDTPALYLYSMVVCRETRERWPRYETRSNVDDSITETLFGLPGAPGGLYDPPPVGSEQQARQYMLLDLEGYASVLFPYKIDQDPEAFDGNGWVQSLDWSPGRIRYQADRKVLGGAKVRGLKTLELSEVEAESADQWRPRDDGQDMRQ